MMKRTRIALLAALALSVCAACTRTDRPAGTVTLSFCTGEPLTRAGENPVADGSAIATDAGMPDLVVLIADASGSVVATYPSADPSETTLSFSDADPTQASIAFRQSALTAGTYTVYAFANTQGLWAMTDGSLTYTAATLVDITSKTTLDALHFVPAAFDNQVQASRLPLSAKGQLTVLESLNGEVSLDLLRCVARVSVDFRNDYGSDLALEDFAATFYHLNPDTGYVLPHTPDVPDFAADGALPLTAASFAIPAGQTRNLSAFVLPGQAPDGGHYTCDIAFSLDKDGSGTIEPANGETFTYTDLLVHDSRARGITSLGRNQTLHILIRISKGQTVSFNFRVAEWESLTETVTFE